MNIVNGENIAIKIKESLKEEIQRLKQEPKLVILYIGFNTASQIYVDKKVAWAKEIGMQAQVKRLEQTTTQELINIVRDLNKDKSVSGYILQLPLPKGINTNEVLINIDPSKDVDGLSPLSLGLLWQANFDAFVPATVLAILECLKHISLYKDLKYSTNELEASDDELLDLVIAQKNVLIINHSIIVGKPLAALLLKHKATITIAHRDTPKSRLRELILSNDIIISATGQTGLIKADMIRDKQILIDVGINKSAMGIGGDIDSHGMEEKDIWLTPVPAGVGPITVAMLLSNTLKAYKNNHQTV